MRPLEGSTWWTTNPGSLEAALVSIRHHMLTLRCHYVSPQTMNLLSGKTVNDSHSASVSITAFVSWYCTTHRLFDVSQQQQPPTPAPTNESFQELQEALSIASSRHSYGRLVEAGKETLFRDLNEIPVSNHDESAFCGELLDCLEMVRVSSENEGMQVLIQCRYCHSVSPDRPSLVINEFLHNNKDSVEAAEWLHTMGYSHLAQCGSVPQKIEMRLRCLRPDQQDKRFAKNASYLHKRFQKWMEWMENTIFKETEKTTFQDVELFVPLQGAVIGGSGYVEPDPALPDPPASQPNWKRMGVRRNDVVVNDNRAMDHVGNKKFRMLVCDVRPDFLSSGDAHRKALARSMVTMVRDDGGTIGYLDERGSFRTFSLPEQVSICTKVLREGVPRLLRPIINKRGPGSHVLECELAPHYGLLHGKVFWQKR